MFPWFQYTSFSLGPLTIQVWGLFIALGIGIGSVLLAKRAKAFGIAADDVYDFALWTIIGSLIGARIVHILFYDPVTYIENPLEIIRVWHGGMSSFGGFLGAAVGIWAHHKRKGTVWLKSMTLRAYAELATLPLLTGWLIGRMGCVMIHDHPGIACNCALAVNHPEQPFLDMALLEILALLPLFLFMLIFRKRWTAVRWQLPVLLMYYGALRFFLDFYRVIDTTYVGLTPAQYLSIVMGIAGARMLLRKDT